MKDSDNLQSDNSYVAVLHDVTVVEISGDDAQEFLSNQFSSDIQELGAKQLQHSSWCDPKGRVLFYMLLAKTENSIYCFVSKGLVEQFCKRLTMFVLRSAVKIEHVDNATLLGINTMAQVSTLPDDSFYFPSTQPSSSTRCVSLIEGDNHQNTIDKLGLPENKDLWLYDEIALGHPHFFPEASGAFLPQNLNLDALNGISFTKGCYPGQEIIARLKYRGKVKQRLALLYSRSKVEASAPIPPMKPIFSIDNQDKKIGTTLNSQKVETNLAVSAVLEVDFLENNKEVCIEDYDGSFSVSPPPYEIDA